jgi:hypothetical protein
MVTGASSFGGMAHQFTGMSLSAASQGNGFTRSARRGGGEGDAERRGKLGSVHILKREHGKQSLLSRVVETAG